MVYVVAQCNALEEIWIFRCVNLYHYYMCVDDEDCKTLIGAVDYAWLFTYAVFLVGR